MELLQNTIFLSLLNPLVLVLIFIFIYFNNKEKLKFKHFGPLFPGPKPILYFGNSLNFILHSADISKKLYEYVEKYGPRYRLWIGNKPYIVLSSAEDVEQVLRGKKFLNKGDDFHEIFGRIFGNGTFSADGAAWKKTRKIFIPPFKSNVLENYYDIINDETRKIMKKFEPLAKTKQTFDISNHVGILSINAVCKSFYDLKNDINENEILIFKEKTRGYLGNCFNLMFQPKLIRKMRQMPKKAFQDVVNGVSLFYQKVIMEGKINQKTNEGEIPGTDEANKKFIHYLRDSTLSDDEKREEIITYSVGGTETVAITLSFTILMLGMHIEIQEKVYEELYDIFGDSERDATNDDLKKMVYLEQVMKEVMRHYPVVPFLFRTATEPATLGKHSVPAGTSVIINVLGLHTNPEYFPEPETFNPDHFSSENCEKLPDCCYLPFSAGLRNCLGKAFAMYEMKIICSSILRKYRIHTALKKEQIRLKHSFVSTSADGFKISISERN